MGRVFLRGRAVVALVALCGPLGLGCGAAQGPAVRAASDLSGVPGEGRTSVRVDQVEVVGLDGVPREELLSLAQAQSRALRSVRSLLGSDGPDSVVLMVPARLRDLERLLARPAGSLSALAAVAIGRDHVWVNREAFAALPEAGRDIVLRHETTHVVVNASGSDDVPLWLEEGLAEFVGYRGSGVRLDVAAEDLLREVSAGRLPDRLPRDSDFGAAAATAAGTPAVSTSVAYHQAWTTCLWLADRIGVEGLLRLYAAVSDVGGADREAAVDQALGDEGITRAQLLDGWRAALSAWARDGSRRA